MFIGVTIKECKKNYNQKNISVEKGSLIFLGDGKPVELDQVRQYLSKGELTFYHARGIIVGCGGAGKTTLLKRLMDAPSAELTERKSTNVVDVHVNAFSVMDETIQGKLRPHSKLEFRLHSAVYSILF